MAPVSVECPIEGCNYTATHAEAAVVVALLSIHASLHVTVPRALGANAKMEKIKRPTKGQAETCKYEMKCTNAECDQINDFTE